MFIITTQVIMKNYYICQSYHHYSSLLKVRRLSSIALETFKIINKNCQSYLYDLINIKKHQYSFRYSNTTELPQVRTIRYGINSFRYTASKLWNELPEHFRNETKLISTWTGNSCRCNACK